MKIFSGTSNPKLSVEIAKNLELYNYTDASSNFAYLV
jgi:hypothetical protein